MDAGGERFRLDFGEFHDLYARAHALSRRRDVPGDLKAAIRRFLRTVPTEKEYNSEKRDRSMAIVSYWRGRAARWDDTAANATAANANTHTWERGRNAPLFDPVSKEDLFRAWEALWRSAMTLRIQRAWRRHARAAAVGAAVPRLPADVCRAIADMCS